MPGGLFSSLTLHFSHERSADVHIFSLNQKQCDVKFGERDSRLAGHSRKKGHAESRAHLGVSCSHHAITTVPHSSLCLPVSVSDERTRSFLDISDSTRLLLQQGQGRSSFLSVKELSARYLSQAAAAAASQGSTTSPVRIIASKRCPIPSEGRGRVRESMPGFTMLEEHSISFPRMPIT